MRRAGSDVNYEQFVIFDERSIQDDTVLIVEKEVSTAGEEAGDASVRVVHEMVTHEMMLLDITGDASVDGDYETASRTENRVLHSTFEES